ncbi:protein of unknown function [Shewanella benthica]|uniref:Uncharacterized protein n=1 Tax=Shewanella benthica TaxID=43661 RepID=A0A330M3S0_9GAMM|nr:protein of unknown function [Shewanella benthica]
MVACIKRSTLTLSSSKITLAVLSPKSTLACFTPSRFSNALRTVMGHMPQSIVGTIKLTLRVSANAAVGMMPSAEASSTKDITVVAVLFLLINTRDFIFFSRFNQDYAINQTSQ